MDSLTDSRTATAARSRGRAIAYWVTTLLIAAEMLVAGMSGILRIPYARDMMQHLGYPDCVNSLLGVWYALGGLALLVPGLPRLDIRMLIGPLILLGLAFASLTLRTISRRLAAPRWRALGQECAVMEIGP